MFVPTTTITLVLEASSGPRALREVNSIDESTIAALCIDYANDLLDQSIPVEFVDVTRLAYGINIPETLFHVEIDTEFVSSESDR